MFLVPTHGGWEFAGMFYSGLSAIFTFIFFILIYALMWNIIMNGTLGRYTRRLAKGILRIQAIVISLVTSLVIHVLYTDSFNSKAGQLISVVAILCITVLLHEIIIRRVAFPIEKSKTVKEGQKFTSFLKSIWDEAKKIGVALKQDSHSKFVRITTAYIFNLLFCYIFLIPFAVISMWLFSLNGILALIPTSLILSLLIDLRLKKKLANNLNIEPMLKTPVD